MPPAKASENRRAKKNLDLERVRQFIDLQSPFFRREKAMIFGAGKIEIRLLLYIPHHPGVRKYSSMKRREVWRRPSAAQGNRGFIIESDSHEVSGNY